MMDVRTRVKPVALRGAGLAESVYLRADRRLIRRTRNLRLVPTIADRRGGKRSSLEWGHVIGIFQTLIGEQVGPRGDARILDVGCGTGLLAIASLPFVSDGGGYTGLDVMPADIEFCRRHYRDEPSLEFVHLDLANATYAPGQSTEQRPWPFDPTPGFDLVTALSVWTHLRPADAEFSLGEVARLLRPGGRALVTFFVLDDDYESSLPDRRAGQGRYHSTSQKKWVFDQPHPESDDWFYPQWVAQPEDAFGVTRDGLDRLVAEAGLTLVELRPGNWKERPGLYFQDIAVIERPELPSA